MPPISHFAWSTIAQELLRERAVRSLPHLSPGYHCTVEYPVRLRSRHGRIYGVYIAAERPNSLYILRCTMWDSAGKSVLLRTTLLVPSREPHLGVNSYHATWDSGLSVFIIRDKDRGFEGVCPKLYAKSVVHTSTSGQDDTNRNDVIYKQENVHELFDIIHTIPESNTYWSDSITPEYSAYPVLRINNDYQQDQDGDISIIGVHNSLSPRQRAQPPMDQDGEEEPEIPAELSQKAQREMERQTNLVSLLGGIHHFNWQREPVMERSETPPELSLYIIHGIPKPWLREISRRAVTLRQAMKYIDPVVYTGPPECLYYNQSEFFRVMTGRVKRFYSKHGAWLGDDYGRDEDKPVLDLMDLTAYAASDWFPVNGWLQTPWGGTYKEYELTVDRMRIKAKRRSHKRAVRRTSLLRRCMNADTSES